MTKYYIPSGVFAAGSLAKGEEIRNETMIIQSAFEKLPGPAVDGFGFGEHFSILDALESNQPVTLSQLNETKITVSADLAAAKLYAEAAEISAASAAESEDAISTASAGITALSSSIIEVRNEAQEQADRALTAANLARDYAFKPAGQTVDGPGTRSALHYSAEAGNQAALAKGFADDARSLTSGARKFIDYLDASSGNLPIAAPTSTDRNKYWVISVAGTLPGVGAVLVNDELTINATNQYSKASINAGVVRSVNGKTGANVVVTIDDIGAAPALHNHSEYLTKANNLSGLPSPATARTNLGLGSAALKNVGTQPFDVVQRDANGNIPGASGSASATAQRLAQAITFSLTGGVTGSVSSDLSGNLSIATTVPPANHTHERIKPLTTAISRLSSTVSQANLVTARTEADFTVQGSILSVPGGTNGQGAFRLIGFDDGTFGWQVADGSTGQFGAIQTPLSKLNGDEFYLPKSGTAAKATRLASARQVRLAGDVEGVSAAFDGSQDATITTTITAAKILDKIKTVDGAGSGLDADTVDGYQASAFVQKQPAALTFSQLWTGSAAMASVTVSQSMLLLISVTGPGGSVVYTAALNTAKNMIYPLAGPLLSGSTVPLLIVNSTGSISVPSGYQITSVSRVGFG